MDMEGGAFPLEMQAKTIVNNIMSYNGSHPCPTCGLIMNPTEAMYSKGMCAECFSQHSARRLKNRMA
jgi:hypothetical protein